MVVLIIFPVILQTDIIVMLIIGGQWETFSTEYANAVPLESVLNKDSSGLNRFQIRLVV